MKGSSWKNGAKLLGKWWKWVVPWKNAGRRSSVRRRMLKVRWSLEKMLEVGQICRKNAGNRTSHRKMGIGNFLE